jgi:hypothetical protein
MTSSSLLKFFSAGEIQSWSSVALPCLCAWVMFHAMLLGWSLLVDCQDIRFWKLYQRQRDDAQVHSPSVWFILQRIHNMRNTASSQAPDISTVILNNKSQSPCLVDAVKAPAIFSLRSSLTCLVHHSSCHLYMGFVITCPLASLETDFILNHSIDIIDHKLALTKWCLHHYCFVEDITQTQGYSPFFIQCPIFKRHITSTELLFAV